MNIAMFTKIGEKAENCSWLLIFWKFFKLSTDGMCSVAESPISFNDEWLLTVSRVLKRLGGFCNIWCKEIFGELSRTRFQKRKKTVNIFTLHVISSGSCVKRVGGFCNETGHKNFRKLRTSF